MKTIACILSVLFIVLLFYGTGSVQCHFIDIQKDPQNTFTAFTSTIWTQTTQADFETGSIKFVDTTTVPGDVILDTAGKKYRSTGNLRSNVLNMGSTGKKIDLLCWDATLPPSTTITFQFRASDTEFDVTSGVPEWIDVGTNPVITNLPNGQYVQWRAYLETSNVTVTPTLHEVQIWYH